MQKIIWLTGPSGAGKSTVAKVIASEIPCIILDGDEMRASISADLGFSVIDREIHNMRVAKLAKVLATQINVVVSVIAPIDRVRKEVDTLLSPIWIYVKRSLPERAGHFYEEPLKYDFMLDHDQLSLEQSKSKTLEILSALVGPKKTYSLFIGRYQPIHEGHIKLISSVLREGKNVVIALRDTNKDPSNPYSVSERKTMFYNAFKDYVDAGRVVIESIPDIEEVCHGRKVGWGIREIKLDEQTESISATEIRNSGKILG